MNSVDRYRSQRYSVRREERERVGGIIKGRRSFRQAEMIIPSVKSKKRHKGRRCGLNLKMKR